MATFLQELVVEKETRIRESMFMMGLSQWVLWTTWYLKQFIFLFISVLIMTILLKVGGKAWLYSCTRIRYLLFAILRLHHKIHVMYKVIAISLNPRFITPAFMSLVVQNSLSLAMHGSLIRYSNTIYIVLW